MPYVLIALSTAGLILAGCGAGRSKERLPFLADQYMPSAAAPAEAYRLPTGSAEDVNDPNLRKQLVMAPDGNVYSLKWRKFSESVGAPASGSLSDPARLPKRGPGFVHIGDDPYGTDETLAYVQFAAWAVEKMYPGTVPVIVGDISDRNGGRLSPHRSHQSGRDADIGFYAKGNKRLKWFQDLGDNLDVAKSWVFIEALLRTRAVKWIFIDRSIQKKLYAHARRQGFAQADLERIFQYPGGRKRTLIRHVRGHRNHLHVRFVCPPEDVDCDP
jgi:murein endopeptidase